MSTHDDQPRKRGGRVVDKATPEQVMALARNLPLTHSLLGKAIENATPGQLGFLANLFEAENASRAESKRRRLPGQAGFPQNKTLDGYDRGHGLVPRRLGTRAAGKPGIRRPGRGPRALRRRGLRQDPPGHRDRRARLPTHDPRQVLHRLEPGHATEKGQGRQQIGHRAQNDRQGRAVIIDELGHLPIDIDGARLLFQAGADSYETRSVIFTSNLESGRWGDVFGDGDMAAAVIDRIVHHGRILRFHGESYRNRHSLMK